MPRFGECHTQAHAHRDIRSPQPGGGEAEVEALFTLTVVTAVSAVKEPGRIKIQSPAQLLRLSILTHLAENFLCQNKHSSRYA